MPHLLLFAFLTFSSLFTFSSAQPFCGEFEGALVFDGSDATKTQFQALLQLVQGTARSFDWVGAEAARIGAVQFSNFVYEEQQVLYYTESEWSTFPNTVQHTGTKNITEALLYATSFVMTPPPPLRIQYIILFVTNNGSSAQEALSTAQLLTSAGQRIVTVFLEGSKNENSSAVSALASSPALAFTLSNDTSTYYAAVYNISRALCTDLNALEAYEDQCPTTYKVSGGMCGCSTYDVNGCALPQCSLPSTFENGTTEGWKIINSNGVLSNPTIQSYSGARNTFNSYLAASQLPAPTSTNPESIRYFLAPSMYLGAQNQLYGGLVLFSLQLQLNLQRITTTVRPRFIIEGVNAELFLYNLPNEGSLLTNAWAQFSIPIINDGSLQVMNKSTGQVSIALQSDIMGVLQYVQSIRVLIDYVQGGYNAANLDNFKFCSYDRLDTFETGTDGYFVVDSEGRAEPSWQLNFISFRQRTSNPNFPFYFVPSWATGVPCVGLDLSELNGGLLGYDINLQTVNSQYTVADDIVITGETKELIYRLLPSEYPTTNLTRVQASISENSGRWYVRPRTTELIPNQPYPLVPTSDDFVEVLSSVSFIYLRGQYLTQVDTTLLHTTYTIANTPQTCTGTPTCSGNGLCVAGGCSCFYGWMGTDCSDVAPCAAGMFQLSDFAA